MHARLQRLPHRLQTCRQRRQAAEVDPAFAGAVEIAAARREEIELARRSGVALGLGGGVAAGRHLDAAAAVVLELGEERVLLVRRELVARRMRDDRDAARGDDPADGIAECRPSVRNEPGLAFDEKAAEYLLRVGTDAGLDEVAREVRARDQLVVAGVAERSFVRSRDADLGELAHAGNHELISRTHFARHLVETGICADTQEVFRRFLVEGKPGLVPHRWATLGDAVGWIVAAGGVAIVAHPARYKFSPTEEYALFTEFKGHGGRGVEVTTGSHTAAEAERYAGTAREFDLLASCGSDFHSPDESRIDLGGLPPLPAGLQPVWETLLSRVHRAA